nr:putative ribonuclease H-like domain-containing protein [Tanacetum cinerariifolium]
MNKLDKRGIVIRNKSRLVAQGHTQEEGIHYDEVFAPVVRIKAIRLFLAYASFKDFMVYQIDVKSAFLYKKIKEEVHVFQPLGFEDPDFPDKVYKVEKALYGLHQTPRGWATTTASSLEVKKNSGNINKTQNKATSNEPSSQGTSSGDGPRCQDNIRDTSAHTRTKTAQQTKIDGLEKRVKKLEKKQRSRTYKLKRLYKGRIDEIDADEDISLVSTHDDVSTQDNIVQDECIEDIEEVVKVVTTAKMIIDDVIDAAQVTTVIADIPVSAAETIVTTTPTITAESIKTNVEVTQDPKRKGVMIQEPEETTTTKIVFSQQPQVPDKEKRRKFFAAKRDEEKRNKPHTKAQQRNLMCNYLKNMEGWKPKSLKNKSFDEVQKLFDKSMKRVNTFVDYRTELVVEGSKKDEVTKGSLKRIGEELEQENAKKQKIKDDKESAELKQCLEIIPDIGDDVTIDATLLSSKYNGIKFTQDPKSAKVSKGLESPSLQDTIASGSTDMMVNYNMHNIGKTIGELHALLIEYEKGLPKKDATPQVMVIQGGIIQKANKKSFNAKGKGKGKGKGKDKSYILKPKNLKPYAKEHPKKDDACHHYKEAGHYKRNCPAYLAKGLRRERKLKQGALYLCVGNEVRAQVKAIGSDGREYSQWVERFMNYLEEQTDGEAMINSIKNGDQPLSRVTQVSIPGTLSTEQPPLKDKSMWSDQEKRVQKIDRLARSLLIQGLLNDIYSLIDSNKTTKYLWDALARHMIGSEYGEQDRKAAV